METRQDKLIRLATEMANKGELKITPDSAEYQLLDYLLTDDQLDSVAGGGKAGRISKKVIK
jgi:hypothetical protein